MGPRAGHGPHPRAPAGAGICNLAAPEPASVAENRVREAP
jgi:hypothetical protein